MDWQAQDPTKIGFDLTAGEKLYVTCTWDGKERCLDATGFGRSENGIGGFGQAGNSRTPALADSLAAAVMLAERHRERVVRSGMDPAEHIITIRARSDGRALHPTGTYNSIAQAFR